MKKKLKQRKIKKFKEVHIPKDTFENVYIDELVNLIIEKNEKLLEIETYNHKNIAYFFEKINKITENKLINYEEYETAYLDLLVLIYESYHEFKLEACLYYCEKMRTLSKYKKSLEFIVVYFEANCYLLQNDEKKVHDYILDLEKHKNYSETFSDFYDKYKIKTNFLINLVSDLTNYYKENQIDEMYKLYNKISRYSVELLEYFESLIKLMVIRNTQKNISNLNKTELLLESEFLYLSLQLKKVAIIINSLETKEQNKIIFKIAIMQNDELKKQILLFEKDN